MTADFPNGSAATENRLILPMSRILEEPSSKWIDGDNNEIMECEVTEATL